MSNFSILDPCLAGSYYSCPARRCLACPPSSYQPQWGQTSCWPCPINTTTDSEGTSSPAGCKATRCVHRSRPGLAVLESPNYPGDFPVSAACHWRVAPGQEESLLILLPYLSLPPACSHTPLSGPRTPRSSPPATLPQSQSFSRRRPQPSGQTSPQPHHPNCQQLPQAIITQAPT